MEDYILAWSNFQTQAESRRAVEWKSANGCDYCPVFNNYVALFVSQVQSCGVRADPRHRERERSRREE